MLNICVCDDNEPMREEICGLISEFGEKHRVALCLFCYGSGEEMLFDLEQNDKLIDIFFLDILMKRLDGIQTASELRNIQPSAQIIFLTISKEHVFDALDVMPLHYLLKQDLDSRKMERVLQKAVSLAENNKKLLFTYKFGKTMGSVLLRDIIYFEVKNRIIEMHLKDKTMIEFYANMSELEQQLANSSFARVHRSFLVNFENVDYLSGKSFVCIDKTEIPLSQTYNAARNKYQAFLLNTISTQ